MYLNLFYLFATIIIFYYNNNYYKSVNKIKNFIISIIISTISYMIVIYMAETNTIYNILSLLTFSFLINLSYIDFRDMEVPDSLNILSLVFAMGAMISIKDYNSIISGYAMIGIFTTIWFISQYLYRREMFGLGDLFIIGIIGMYLNYIEIIYVFLISSIIAIPVSIISIYLFKKKEIPYLPFLLIGFYIELLFPNLFML